MSSVMITSPYTACSINIAADTPVNVLAAIRTQIDPNADGAGTEIVLYADGPLLVGGTNVGSTVNGLVQYGYALDAGLSRTYRAGNRDESTPLGRLWVFSVGATAVLHVEIIS